MRIMVFDVPAESGGALSVLNDFYNDVNADSSNEVEWVFVISIPKLNETEKIKVIRYPWIKKSWFHRLYFDHFIASKIIKDYKIDKILSLQNTAIPHTTIEQILYVHNSLPFIEHKFSLLSNTLLWTYQNIISIAINNSIKKADLVIAQTEWMKKAFIRKNNITPDKVKVIPPKIIIEVNETFDVNCLNNVITFFFPASAVEFKNHKIIVDACRKLTEEKMDYKVVFTISGDENQNALNLKKIIEDNNLNISLLGMIPRTEVFERYKDSILVFPSYVESSPLPLSECLMYKGIVFASDTSFSREILDGYNNAYFFNPFKENELYELMKSAINNKLSYKKVDFVSDKNSSNRTLIDTIC